MRLILRELYRERTDLLLKGEDVRDAAVDGVAEARLGLEADGDHRIEALVRGDVKQQLRNVACTEDLVHGRKVRRALVRVEVGSEDTAAHALSTQKLARAARPATATNSGTTAAASDASTAACTSSTHATLRVRFSVFFSLSLSLL